MNVFRFARDLKAVFGPEGKAPLPFLDIVVCNRSRYIDFQLIFHCNCNRNCQGMCIPCMSYMSSISSCLP